MTASLLSIVAHARAGALEHALRLFQEAGLDERTDDPAVLSLKGRLLKDQARLAEGEERRALYARSAEAYDAAGAISWGTYPLINAASLSLLAGDPDRARALAAKVMSRLDQRDSEPDTPYWRQATRAEAELLLGRHHQARESLKAAIALAPRAWEDHASTLRQFALILERENRDASWLAPLRPPRVLHFAGHLGVDPQDAALAGQIREMLRVEKIGFGYGALAAGADIVIAEALLAHGAELHLVLPTGREVFRALSVASLGGDWDARFDEVLARAETVTSVGPTSALPGPLTLMLAAQVAMGRAAMQARLLATEALQLIILDPEERSAAGGTGGSAWTATAWDKAGRRSLVLASPRVRPVPQTSVLKPTPGERFVAVLALAPGDDDQAFSRRLPDLWAALGTASRLPDAPPVWSGTGLLLAFGDCETAAAAARLAMPFLKGGRIAAAAGTAQAVPLTDGPMLIVGPPVETARRLMASVPPGAALATATFAAALCAGADDGACSGEPVGELPPAEIDELGDDQDRSVFSLSVGLTRTS
ncbi:MAG: DUF4071 domain-containing protein [Caulobacter sp.]|nr:DUF4071 domain-containing protein [Caulobacter sp.]